MLGLLGGVLGWGSWVGCWSGNIIRLSSHTLGSFCSDDVEVPYGQ